MRNLHLLLPLIGSLSIGCDVGDVTVEETIAQPNLRILEEDTASRVILEPDRLAILDEVAGDLAAAHVGDVLLAHAPVPFLRKVIAIDDTGPLLTFTTEPAALTDAILEGHMQSSRDLAGEQAAGSPDELIVGINALNFDFSKTQVINEGDLKVTINKGTVSFRPYVDLDLRVGWFGVDKFQAIVHGDLEATMGVSIVAAKNISRSFSKTIWTSQPYVVTQWIGFVPVVETVTVSLVLSGEAHAGVNATLDLGGANAKASLAAGAVYENGQWRGVATPSLEFSAYGPSATASASAGASLQLTTRVDVKFYDVAGPYLTVGPYANAEVNNTGWSARVGMKGAFGGSVSVLGHNLASYNQQLFDVGKSF